MNSTKSLDTKWVKMRRSNEYVNKKRKNIFDQLISNYKLWQTFIKQEKQLIVIGYLYY